MRRERESAILRRRMPCAQFRHFRKALWRQACFWLLRQFSLTGKNEEALVILHGQGEALIDGQAKQPFVAPALVYIPPETRHNVANTGKEPLEYVYVVAPAKAE